MKLKFRKFILEKFTRKIDRFPGVIEKNKIYIIPTKEGFIFFISIFIIFLGSINENNNMGLMFSFFLFSVFVISLFDTRKNILGIKINSIVINDTFAGMLSKVDLYLDPEAKKRFSISINSETDSISKDIKKDESSRITIQIKAEKRGVFKAPYVSLSSRYPFGIFKAEIYIIPDSNQIVYPKIHSGKSDLSYLKSKDQIGDEGDEKRKNMDDEFQGLKEYVKGDSFKRISWKTFSKGLGLHVKDFDSNENEQDEVIIDMERIPEEDIEEKLSIMCRAILDLEKKGIKYGLKLENKILGASNGEKHKKKALRMLASHGEN